MIFPAYIQEVGRAGRDGKESIATLYYNKSDISPNVKGMTEEMRLYCDLDTCRRKYVCKHFGFKLEGKCDFDHQCCDNCATKCECDMCIIVRDDLAEESNNNTNSLIQLKDPLNSVTKKKTLHEMLNIYFEAEHDILLLPNGSLYTGLTTNLAQHISENYQKYMTISNIQQDYPQLNSQIISNINNIIKAVCQQSR